MFPRINDFRSRPRRLTYTTQTHTHFRLRKIKSHAITHIFSYHQSPSQHWQAYNVFLSSEKVNEYCAFQSVQGRDPVSTYLWIKLWILISSHFKMCSLISDYKHRYAVHRSLSTVTKNESRTSHLGLSLWLLNWQWYRNYFHNAIVKISHNVAERMEKYV